MPFFSIDEDALRKVDVHVCTHPKIPEEKALGILCKVLLWWKKIYLVCR